MKVVIASILAVATIGALACGESLFRVGKGVTYRAYVAPLPGNILVVARTKGERAMADALMSAGHNVHVVADATELGAALKYRQFDIVLARFNEREVVAQQTVASTVTYLPVATENSAEEDLAKELYRRSLSSDDSLKRFLKTIHKTLRNA